MIACIKKIFFSQAKLQVGRPKFHHKSNLDLRLCQGWFVRSFFAIELEEKHWQNETYWLTEYLIQMFDRPHLSSSTSRGMNPNDWLKTGNLGLKHMNSKLDVEKSRFGLGNDHTIKKRESMVFDFRELFKTLKL